MLDPVLIAYGVKRRSNGKSSRWQRIGTVYPHDSGAGLTVILDLMPLDGRIVLLERDDADDDWLDHAADPVTLKTTAEKRREVDG